MSSRRCVQSCCSSCGGCQTLPSSSSTTLTSLQFTPAPGCTRLQTPSSHCHAALMLGHPTNRCDSDSSWYVLGSGGGPPTPACPPGCCCCCCCCCCWLLLLLLLLLLLWQLWLLPLLWLLLLWLLLLLSLVLWMLRHCCCCCCCCCSCCCCRCCWCCCGQHCDWWQQQLSSSCMLCAAYTRSPPVCTAACRICQPSTRSDLGRRVSLARRYAATHSPSPLPEVAGPW